MYVVCVYECLVYIERGVGRCERTTAHAILSLSQWIGSWCGTDCPMHASIQCELYWALCCIYIIWYIVQWDYLWVYVLNAVALHERMDFGYRAWSDVNTECVLFTICKCKKKTIKSAIWFMTDYLVRDCFFTKSNEYTVMYTFARWQPISANCRSK